MKTGYVFDIKEFTVNDGPGVRVTVFFKGCPLRCVWCHNPEGLSFRPQLNQKTGLIVGKAYTSKALASRIIKFKDLFDLSGGGVTFSGGEPTAQAEFLMETLLELGNIHKTLDTSGFCNTDIFEKLIKIFNLVYFDIKLALNGQHKHFTGVSNDIILKNLNILGNSCTPYHIRVPLIPDITDTMLNFNKIYSIIKSLKTKPQKIDLLPYNKLAGGKYGSYGMMYHLRSDISINLENVDKFMKELDSDMVDVELH